MNKNELEAYITETYGVSAEYPWLRYPTYAVFRHKCNQKWSAVVMDIPRSKLGLNSEEKVSIMNVKCDFILIGSLLEQKGFYPAYHMNKANWISVALDGSAEDETIKWLLDMSFDIIGNKG